MIGYVWLKVGPDSQTLANFISGQGSILQSHPSAARLFFRVGIGLKNVASELTYKYPKKATGGVL